jgi:alpha-L-fucosidase
MTSEFSSRLRKVALALSIATPLLALAQSSPTAPTAKYQAPEWYKDAKFGIFIHWGVYSVPAFGSEWYPREMYIQGSDVFKHHVATYGPLTSSATRTSFPCSRRRSSIRRHGRTSSRNRAQVRRSRSSSTTTASQCMTAGSPTGPREDGAASRSGGELAKAVRAEGLHLGASSHRIEHDFFLDGGRKTSLRTSTIQSTPASMGRPTPGSKI